MWHEAVIWRCAKSPRTVPLISIRLWETSLRLENDQPPKLQRHQASFSQRESRLLPHTSRGALERGRRVSCLSLGEKELETEYCSSSTQPRPLPPAPNQMVTTWTPEPISRLFIGGQNYPAPKKLGFTSLRLRENYSLCKEPRKYNAAWEDKPIEWTWLRANTVSAAPVTKAVFTGLHMFTWKRQDKP